MYTYNARPITPGYPLSLYIIPPAVHQLGGDFVDGKSGLEIGRLRISAPHAARGIRLLSAETYVPFGL